MRCRQASSKEYVLPAKTRPRWQKMHTGRLLDAFLCPCLVFTSNTHSSQHQLALSVAPRSHCVHSVSRCCTTEALHLRQLSPCQSHQRHRNKRFATKAMKRRKMTQYETNWQWRWYHFPLLLTYSLEQIFCCLMEYKAFLFSARAQMSQLQRLLRDAHYLRHDTCLWKLYIF